VHRDAADNGYLVLGPEAAEDHRVLLDIDGACPDIPVQPAVPAYLHGRRDGEELHVQFRAGRDHQGDLGNALVLGDEIVDDTVEFFLVLDVEEGH
jgi:hypothetical protein